mmetsp:Transcript_1033/g.2590  ORF Transcript_1033/g.2590 Transcript_1033/m.2590 type:complete len:245 (-) Transcript_1033:389-1123(-)
MSSLCRGSRILSSTSINRSLTSRHSWSPAPICADARTTRPRACSTEAIFWRVACSRSCIESTGDDCHSWCSSIRCRNDWRASFRYCANTSLEVIFSLAERMASTKPASRSCDTSDPHSATTTPVRLLISLKSSTLSLLLKVSILLQERNITCMYWLASSTGSIKTSSIMDSTVSVMALPATLAASFSPATCCSTCERMRFRLWNCRLTLPTETLVCSAMSSSSRSTVLLSVFPRNSRMTSSSKV